MEFTQDQLDRFWAKVDKSGDCWEWTGAINNKGYGQIRIHWKCYLAHRASYLIHYGEINKPALLHSCDNRKCVRPDHLREGTVKENNRDMADKGRGRNQFSSIPFCHKGHPFSDENTWRDKRGGRYCRACSMLKMRTVRLNNKIFNASLALFANTPSSLQN